MASPSEVEAQVRFALSQLPVRSGHHEFEQICRSLSQQFICTNVLPATGPVSAGGDQGRDFETFRTYLLRELGPNGGFLGLVSEGTIAFVCTTQAKNLTAKLRSDIEKVCSSGHGVHEIRAFTLNPLPIASRHLLQSEAFTTHGVVLEIHDAESISNLLARPEGFWIAERYLSIPAEIRPAPDEESSELGTDYAERRRRWRALNAPSPTPGDFYDLTAGLRYATFDRQARPDLPFWIGSIRELLSDAELPERLRHRAVYELAVATLRGTHDLRPVDGMVRAFLNESLNQNDPARLQDAGVLLSYACGAAQRGLTTIGLAELTKWNRALREHVEERISLEAPHRRASLQFTLGYLGLQLALTDEDIPDAPLPKAEIEKIDNLVMGSGVLSPASVDDLPFVDESRALSAWTELVASLGETPLFPVNTLGQMLQMFMPLWRQSPQWRRLLDQVDEAISARSGANAVAARARDRAMSLLEEGYRLEALEEFHRVKVDWWSGETVRGSLLAMLMISRIYAELRLPAAAKAYALAAAYVAWSQQDDELSDLISRSLIEAASADFLAGSWCGAIELYDLALKSLHSFAASDMDSAERSEVQDALLKFTYITSCALDFDPALAEVVRAVTSQLGLDEAIDEIVASGSPSREPWGSFALGDLAGPPFSDLGSDCRLRFAALGIQWSLESNSDAKSIRMCERFAAAVQVVMAALAKEDLCLLPTEINVRIEERRGAKSTLTESMPSNDGRKWIVRLSPVVRQADVDVNRLERELLTALTIVLRECSLLPDEEFTATLERAFEQGLMHKLFPARPYDELAAMFAADTEPELKRDQHFAPWSGGSEGRSAHEELSWQEGPGPTFSREKADELLQGRYELLLASLRRTVRKLRGSSGFLSIVARLRAEGWLDWHILLAVSNIRMTELNRAKLKWPIAELDMEEMIRKSKEQERDDAKLVPPHRFSYRAMHDARRTALLSLVRLWDLEPHQSTPDFPAIERLLAARYGYWDEDVDHLDPFPEKARQ